MTNETWIPAPGTDGFYSVSDQGRVRSEPRSFIRSNGRKGTYISRVLAPRPRGGSGYLAVELSVRGKSLTAPVHRLVCEAFHGPAPEGKPLALHKDGNPLNNTPENLYWGDASENQRDAVTHGTHNQSRKTHCRWGHAFDEVNTRWNNGHRVCRACHSRRETIRTREKRGVVRSV